MGFGHIGKSFSHIGHTFSHIGHSVSNVANSIGSGIGDGVSAIHDAVSTDDHKKGGGVVRVERVGGVVPSGGVLPRISKPDLPSARDPVFKVPEAPSHSDPGIVPTPAQPHAPVLSRDVGGVPTFNDEQANMEAGATGGVEGWWKGLDRQTQWIYAGGAGALVLMMTR